MTFRSCVGVSALAFIALLLFGVALGAPQQPAGLYYQPATSKRASASVAAPVPIALGVGLVIDYAGGRATLRIREKVDAYMQPEGVPPFRVATTYTFDPDSLRVLIDGKEQMLNHQYSIEPTNDAVTFYAVPKQGQWVQIRYRY